MRQTVVPSPQPATDDAPGQEKEKDQNQNEKSTTS